VGETPGIDLERRKGLYGGYMEAEAIFDRKGN